MAATDKISFGDTKVTNTKNNTTKAYLTGTTSSATNTGTQIFDDQVYVTSESGGLHCLKQEIGEANLEFDTDLQLLSITF